MYKYTGSQLGTVINITIISESESDAIKASEQAFNEIERIENEMSPYRKGSDVYNINNYAFKNPVKISKETFDIIKKSAEMSNITDGGFDITFATISHLWNFNKDGFAPPSREAVIKLLPYLNYKLLQLDPDNLTVKIGNEKTKIGLGAIAKGYAVKMGIIAMKNVGIKNAIMEAGGDLQVAGNKYNEHWFTEQWKIGLRHPRNDKLILSLNLSDMDSVVTSGDYERFAMHDSVRYHHIMDPKTGFPAKTFASVTVLSKDPVDADAFATAFFVMGKEKTKQLLKKKTDLKAIFIDLDLKISASRELKDKISLLEDIDIEWF